jgi:hypothetical protein
MRGKIETRGNLCVLEEIQFSQLFIEEGFCGLVLTTERND